MSRMSIDMASPRSSTSTMRRPKRDTGFPESLDSCGTSRPHPDADLSPNATISQDDLVSMSDNRKRSRLPFLHRHKRNATHGFLSPQMAALHSVLSVTSIDTSTFEEPRRLSNDTESKTSDHSDNKENQSKRHDDDDRGDSPPTSPDDNDPNHDKANGITKWFRG
ncbi:hypothetical protein VHEMI08688 [[Torrubiella] hemipterigena]|uniref:Uncharacterized protein n=1 Tax=[Torrubiella] hemipterigena TaxID=1531966 RepID=A0A0A1TNY2_9HYPO|nr:hypothetical protein VHEMI08688 [[Torrubiella] hemipterigena]